MEEEYKYNNFYKILNPASAKGGFFCAAHPKSFPKGRTWTADERKMKLKIIVN